MKKMFLALVLLSGIASLSKAGDNQYVIGEKMTIQSNILNEERGIIVYLPETYNLVSQNYPVLYLLDGDAHFHHGSGIVKFLAGNGNIPEMIVVAIQNVDRTRDFSPSHLEQYPTSGGAEKFLQFLGEELIPFVDQQFRTEPYRILMGHSFGGSFAVFAMLSEPTLFNAYISISPYLMYDNLYTVKLTKKELKKVYRPDVMLYMTIGNEPAYFESLDEFRNIVEKQSPEGLKFTLTKMDDENHGSIAHLSIYRGLESIFSGWKLPDDAFSKGLNFVDQHYRSLSEKYNYNIQTPEYVINALGYYFLRQTKEMEKAISTFLENVDRFPNSANVYDSLGEAYENDQQFENAYESYQKAVAYASKVNHPNLSIYEKNLKRMQEKIIQN